MAIKACEYSACHPSAAFWVPYMWRNKRPHNPFPADPCSGGNSTNIGSSGFVLALKYAREMSRKDNCILLGCSESQTFQLSPAILVHAKLKTNRSASSGGVGANTLSLPGDLISLATRRDLTLGQASSPLFTSTHLTLMGRRFPSLIASLILVSSQTFLLSK